MKICKHIASLNAKLDIRENLGDDVETFIAEISLTNFLRAKVILVAAIVVFVALLALDVYRFYAGIWTESSGYRILFWAHCAMVTILMVSLQLMRLKPVRTADEIQPFHRFLVNVTVFLTLLNMIALSVGDILVNGSMVAYLGTLFAIAAAIVMTDAYSLLLYLGNMAVMLLALTGFSRRFGVSLEIQIVNLVCFTLIAWVLSRVLFFHNLKNFQDQRLIGRQHRELEELATLDPLTHILNRRRFLEMLNAEIDRSRRYSRPFSLALFDLDHFKQVNDRFGHNVGDTVLKEVARLVCLNLRQTDIFTRWGGEEFIIVSPETNLDGMKTLADKLRRAIENHQPSNAPGVTASFGVTQYTDREDVEKLINRADEALYHAKDSGRNRVCVNHG